MLVMSERAEHVIKTAVLIGEEQTVAVTVCKAETERQIGEKFVQLCVSSIERDQDRREG